MFKTILTFVAAIISCSCAHQQVQLPSGKYVGVHDANSSTTTYYAIPFAYAERFCPPQPIDTKTDLSQDATINASVHGAACIQFKIPPPYDKGFSVLLGDDPIQPQSEDCLSMDIYVPDGNHKDLPVLFYTPGGGFLVGASFLYDMKAMVGHSVIMEKPFIAVVINYRLGPLGFLNPSTFGEDINMGLLDQFEALRFVNKYIELFGGNPEKVTIMGQSAGGDSTALQLLWADRNLFRSAFVLSPPITDPFIGQHPGYKDGLVKSYAKACGCAISDINSGVECLRNTSVEIMTNRSVAWEGSMVGLGGVVKENYFDVIRRGDFPNIPMMFSNCRDEGTAEAIGFMPNTSREASISIQNAISGRNLTGRRAQEFLSNMLEAYPNDPALGCPYNGQDTDYGKGSQYKRMAAISTDLTYAEPFTEYLNTFSRRSNVFGILWEEPIPGFPPAYGVMHGSDLGYYFPTLWGPDADPRAHGQEALVEAVQKALVNFVNDGDPNGCVPDGGVYHWPEYSETQMITVMNASLVAQAIFPPRRPGFDVIHEYLRPGPFFDSGKRADLNLQV